MRKNLSEPERVEIYSFLCFEEQLDLISRLSKNERSMLGTKYSKILKIKKDFEPFSSLHNQLE